MYQNYKKFLTFLDYYKLFGIETRIQSKPRIRFENNLVSNNKENLKGKLLELKEKISNLDCEIKTNAKNFVFYDGILNSDIMIIGEAPGYEEDKLGKPFVGRAGKKLDEMINAIGLNRKKNVYITNIIPWRPPNNRTPTNDEILQCLPYLQKHIELIKPNFLLL